MKPPGRLPPLFAIATTVLVAALPSAPVTAQEPARCTKDTLLSFAPAEGRILDRQPLPSFVSERAPEPELLEELPCEPQEDEARCQLRTQRDAARRHPGQEIECALIRDIAGYDVEFAVDGIRHTAKMASAEEAFEWMQSFKRTGHQVLPLRLQARFGPSRARVLALRPGKAVPVEVLRMRLRWALPAGEMPAILKRLKRQTAAAGIRVDRFEPQPGGMWVLIETSCDRAPATHPSSMP